MLSWVVFLQKRKPHAMEQSRVYVDMERKVDELM